MRFDTPATRNPIDQMKVVGQPVDRVDGPLKVTGTAPYAYERHDVAPDAAYGWIIAATIARGRIVAMDVSAAERAPGVRAIVTAGNAGPLAKGRFNTAPLLGGPQIVHYHQAIGLVVADTFEQARAAAALVRVTYEESLGAFDFARACDDAVDPGSDGLGGPSTTRVGDFDAAFAAADVKLDATYTTPDQSHAMMEPHASTAAWDGDRLTVWTSNQMIEWSTAELARTLGIPRNTVRLVSPYIGGGFGAKLFVRADAVLAALGARAAGRAVKVALPRPLIINNTTHRPATIQRIRIGAGRDGRISAIAHESWSGDLEGGKPETAVNQTRLMYAGAHRLTAMRLATLDLPEGNAMRAPGEAPGMMALEIAMDEMAEQLGMDPVAFRILNDTAEDPERPGRPFSSQRLADCLRQGAERFGWSRRNARPGQVSEGDWLIGMGVAAGFRNNLLTRSGARVTLDGTGRITVETAMTDIGTGSYTILAQTAAEMMGVGMDSVTVRLGDSALPASCGSGGQWGANNASAGVYAACVRLREAVAQQLGFNSADTVFADGTVRVGARRALLADAARNAPLSAEDAIEYGDIAERFQQSTFASHFAEVAVDSLTGEIRVRRMLAVCAAGRILNPKTARSQIIGAMTMGVGAALMEALHVDTRRGFFVNHDLAGYEVPVHADIPHQDVIFLEDEDAMSSPMKAKGVGELGLCGVPAAIANAAYNATGIRLRTYPLGVERHLPGLRG